MNWAAFFLTAFWMGYRRMHRNALLCILASAGVWVSVHQLFVHVFHAQAAPPSAMLIVNVMFALVCGAYGNVWYLAHAKRQIAAARVQGLQGEHLYYTLARRGGTSWMGAMGWMFGVLAVPLILGIVLGVVLVILAHSAR